MRNKTGQVWTFDLVVGVLIFGMAMFIFFKAYMNFTYDAQANFDELLIDSKSVSNALVYTGYPTDWNTTNYQRIGITDGTSTIIQEKLRMFKNLSETDYPSLRASFSIRNDFFVMFVDDNQTLINVTDNISFIGPPNVEPADVISNNSVEDLARITRFITFETNNSPFNRTKEPGIMVVYTWK